MTMSEEFPKGYQLKYVTLLSSQLRRSLLNFDILFEISPTQRCSPKGRRMVRYYK